VSVNWLAKPRHSHRPIEPSLFDEAHRNADHGAATVGRGKAATTGAAFDTIDDASRQVSAGGSCHAGYLTARSDAQLQVDFAARVWVGCEAAVVTRAKPRTHARDHAGGVADGATCHGRTAHRGVSGGTFD